MVEIGDRVLVESEKVGAATRSGVVTDVDGSLITVRWDSGSSSTFVPSAGCLQVTGHEPQAQAANKLLRSSAGAWKDPQSGAPGP